MNKLQNQIVVTIPAATSKSVLLRQLCHIPMFFTPHSNQNKVWTSANATLWLSHLSLSFTINFWKCKVWL